MSGNQMLENFLFARCSTAQGKHGVSIRTPPKIELCIGNIHSNPMCSFLLQKLLARKHPPAAQSAGRKAEGGGGLNGAREGQNCVGMGRLHEEWLHRQCHVWDSSLLFPPPPLPLSLTELHLCMSEETH